ncbi:MAG: hypothetical protein K2I53_11945 [Lachnospiraceae bacterium]|nr:hypothetical protein [Lachnospiraceae bacterium]
MVQSSTGNDDAVNVDNFVEIGDFSDIFGYLLKIWGAKMVEKSMNGFWFEKKQTNLVNRRRMRGHNIFDAEWQIVVY